MSFTVILPLLVGGLASYASKKTEKNYFYEQGVIGCLGYGVGLTKALSNADKIVMGKGVIPALFIVPAALIGGSLYAGRQVGQVGYDALA